MRLTLAILSLSLLMGAQAVPSHAEVAPIAPDMEGCIRDNATKVEAAEPDLNKAVDYLVLNVCAVPLANERDREAQRMQDKEKADAQQACDKWKAAHPEKEGADAEEDDGEYAFNDPCASLDVPGWSAIYVTASIAQGMKPPAATALASQLILDLRLSHSKAGSSH